MELIIKTPTEQDFVKEISFNKDEIMDYVEKSLEKYKNFIVTGKQIGRAHV